MLKFPKQIACGAEKSVKICMQRRKYVEILSLTSKALKKFLAVS
jgi:hypothetical protein